MLTSVGTWIISEVLPPIVTKASSMAMDQYDVYKNIRTEINKLKVTLENAKPILEKAEERQAENSGAVRELLREIVDIGYEARDVLDDFITSTAAVNANRNSNPIPVTFDCFTPFASLLRCFGFVWSSGVQVVIPFAQKNRIAYHITSIKDRLDDIMNAIKGKLADEPETVCQRQRPVKSSYENKQKNQLVGRKVEKEGIMQKVLNHTDNQVHIVPILGIGGIGKTTLAQSIFNDDRVTENMYPSKNRVWQCVGEKLLNVNEIIMSFVDGLHSTSADAEIEKRLVAKFKGDKFLIVLDDVWEVKREEWKRLFNPLTNVGKGGVVILTTRRSQVVDITNTRIPDSLQPLSDEECWLIFERHAFADGNSENSNQDLKSIGKQIVGKLMGLPLAAEVVGCSLLNEPDAKIWKSFLAEKKWLQKNSDNDIIPALKWSYNRLPSHLKQCFTYCSLFPKDHEFDKTLLIEMWMAHDLIVTEARSDVGGEYFNELVNASFFQRINGKYVMHDMIHELALYVSNNEFITLSKDSSSPQMDKVRHVNIIQDDDYSKNLRLCKSKRILTVYTNHKWVLLAFTHSGKDLLVDVFKQLKSIRVLVLSDHSITEIPDCINELKHLRYLDVIKTMVQSLPDSICELYHLQTLVAKHDVDLPNNVGNLTNLRHLRGAILPTCKGIAKLTSLQELSGISVCEGDCISELGNLTELRGTLDINGLDNVISSEDAAQAEMKKKTRIDQLILRFKKHREQTLSSEEFAISRDVLEALNCPPYLKSLSICYYKGDNFPSWLTNAGNGSMEYLSFLEIHGCQVVESLELDALVSLKHLYVGHCPNLRRIRLAKDVAATIEDLTIPECPELMEMEIESLPSLRKVRLSNCNKLSSFPPPCLDKIESLDIRYCQQLSSLGFIILEEIKFLKDLEIRFNPMLKHFSIVHQVGPTSRLSTVKFVPGINSLKHFHIDGCPMLKPHFSIVSQEGPTSSSSSSSSSSASTAVLALPCPEEYSSSSLLS